MENTKAIQLELKYCERCGGLGTRPRGSDLIFCAACARVLAGLAPNSNLTTHVLHRDYAQEPQRQRGLGTESGGA